jgi:hypothetical protein
MKVAEHSQNRSKMDHMKGRWFQLFFIDFQLFYFLTRIVRVIYRNTCNIEACLNYVITFHNNTILLRVESDNCLYLL